MCAGYNGYGQIGDGTLTSRPAPVQVYGAQSWSAIPANGLTNSGNSHFCAVKSTDQTMWCWVRTRATTLLGCAALPRAGPVNVGAPTRLLAGIQRVRPAG